MFRAASRNLTLTALAVALATGLFLSPAALAQSTSGEKEQEQARQNEIRRRADEEHMDRVRRLKDRFLIQVQQSNEMLTKLAATNEAFAKQRNDLLTSDEGKGLVRDPISFTAFLQMHQHPSFAAEEIKAKQKAAASIADGLKAEGKQLDVGYVPSAETQQEAVELYVWARDRSARLEGEQATLKTMLSKAPKIEDPSKAPTLAKAIEEYQARWYQLLAESKILGEQAAEKEAKQIAVDASRLAKLEQANAERDRILEQTRAELAQMKAAYLVDVLQAKKDAERKQFDAERSYADAKAELERLRRDAATSRAAQDTEADIARNKVVDDTKRKEQIALMKSKEVQELLAPFFAKGNWLPGTGPGSRTSQPMSLSELSAYGALKPDASGLGKLLYVGTTTNDKDRPRWSYGHPLSRLTASDRDKLAKAQEYLIQMGEIMVAEGLLAK